MVFARKISNWRRSVFHDVISNTYKEVNSIAWALWGSTFLRDFFLCGVYESIRKNGGHEAGVLLNRGRLQPKIPPIHPTKNQLPTVPFIVLTRRKFDEESACEGRAFRIA